MTCQGLELEKGQQVSVSKFNCIFQPATSYSPAMSDRLGATDNSADGEWVVWRVGGNAAVQVGTGSCASAYCGSEASWKS